VRKDEGWVCGAQGSADGAPCCAAGVVLLLAATKGLSLLAQSVAFLLASHLLGLVLGVKREFSDAWNGNNNGGGGQRRRRLWSVQGKHKGKTSSSSYSHSSSSSADGLKPGRGMPNSSDAFLQQQAGSKSMEDWAFAAIDPAFAAGAAAIGRFRLGQ